MPLTAYQAELGRLLAANRSEDSYVAGGAAILAEPNTRRYSEDLDYFHDTPERVASAYEADRETLLDQGYVVEPELMQPGYIRAVVRRADHATKVEWAYDSSWRFMPVIRSDQFGYQLHPIDLATNKVLALAGRDEPRDLLDTLHVHHHVLELGPLVWAAVGKDPGFSPLSLLELLRRRGKVRPEDLARLHLVEPVDVKELKADWLAALDSAEVFVRSRPPEEVGCLYYAPALERFVDPNRHDVDRVVRHFGRPGGVLPRILESPDE
ncbi:MAG: hypothetical protein HY704_04475 [Gemmatimonadetes bacterium]|nr:hypothetical protein [Gemmatimonadota bacterium]